MNFFKNENTLLKIIKFGPILFVITISFFFTQLFINQQSQHFEDEIHLVKSKYIEQNKQRVKEEVDRIHNSLKFSLEHIEEDLKNEVTNRGNEAYLLATNIYKQSKIQNLNDKEIFNKIKTTLGNIIFDDGKGYYFIINNKGTLLLQPLNIELENKNIQDTHLPGSKRFAQNITQAIKLKQDSYQSYIWRKKDTPHIQSKKISYSKYFEPFDIMIGTGKHLDEYEKTIQLRQLNQINNLKFNNGSFIFIYNKKGTNLAHKKNELRNKNHLSSKNIILKNSTSKIIHFMQNNNNGFVTYKTNENFKDKEKTSYIRLFKEWNWIIGSGFYLDNFQQEIQKKEIQLQNERDNVIHQIILSSIVMTILFIIISFFISKFLNELFTNYKKTIENEIKKTIEKEKILIQQSKLAAMGEMIGNIAHQWKQPLSIISMATGSIKINKELNTLTNEDIDLSTKHIEDATSYLTETIDDFRNFFNPNKEKTHFTTAKLIDKTLRLVYSQYKNNNIEIIQNIENIELLSYENELLQVIINLLNNARDALIKESKEYQKYIFITIYSTKKYLIIKIKDNANGVPENILNKIFDSHFTTKTTSGGTGIGLYMSKQIIENSILGTLKVENVNYDYQNTNFNGAEFTIKILNNQIN